MSVPCRRSRRPLPVNLLTNSTRASCDCEAPRADSAVGTRGQIETPRAPCAARPRSHARQRAGSLPAPCPSRAPLLCSASAAGCACIAWRRSTRRAAQKSRWAGPGRWRERVSDDPIRERGGERRDPVPRRPAPHPTATCCSGQRPRRRRRVRPVADSDRQPPGQPASSCSLRREGLQAQCCSCSPCTNRLPPDRAGRLSYHVPV